VKLDIPISTSLGIEPTHETDTLAREVARRRTFAIISHPDAGKTTLTEKLLLDAGAIELAGAVRGRKTQRHVVSDWMEMEQQRGISVSLVAIARLCRRRSRGTLSASSTRAVLRSATRYMRVSGFDMHQFLDFPQSASPTCGPLTVVTSDLTKR
jgi:hypothetical protein